MRKILLSILTVLCFVAASSQTQNISAGKIRALTSLRPPLDTTRQPYYYGELVSRLQDSAVYMGVATTGQRWIKQKDGGGTATGTVTSIIGGFGLTGGTITTTGTFALDTAAMATRARVQKAVDSLGALIGGLTEIAPGYGVTMTPDPIVSTGFVGVDTFSVTTWARVKKSIDSLAAISGGSNFANTNLTFTANRTHTMGAFSLSLTDGTTFSSWDLTSTSFNNTRYGTSNRNAVIENYGTSSNSGTLAQITANGSGGEQAYFQAKGDGTATIKGLVYMPDYASPVAGTVDLLLALDASGNVITTSPPGGTGTVTSVSAGYGTAFTTFTTSGSIVVDTAAMATRARVQKGIDSLAALIGGAGVTSVSAGYGTSFTTITTTGSVIIDTAAMATRARVQKGIDSLAALISAGGVSASQVKDYVRNPAWKLENLMGSSAVFTTLNKDQSDVTQVVALTDGRLQIVPFLATESVTINNVTFWQGAQGVYTADNENSISIYSASGGTLTEIGTTGDLPNLWKGTANSMQTAALTAGVSLTAGTLYYIAFVYNTSAPTTAPSIGWYPNMVASNITSANFTNNNKISSYLTGQTGCPSSITMSSTTNYQVVPYLHVY